MSLGRALQLLERQERRRLDGLRVEIAEIRDQLKHAAASRTALDRRWDLEIAPGLAMPGGAAIVAAYARILDHERRRLDGLMVTLREREDRNLADLDTARQRRRSLENVHARMTATEARERADRQQRDIDELASGARVGDLRTPVPA